MKQKLPIYEHFFTWQGEGIHQGRSAYFIRTFGCPVHCPWCDSAGTWHPDYIPNSVEKISPEVLVEVALKKKPSILVITGGEPAIHDLSELTEICHKKGLPIHIETSGAFPIRGSFDWVTLSPKVWKPPIKESMLLADELKIIVDSENSIEDWLSSNPEMLQCKTIWLHPEWTQRNNPLILDSITDTIKQYGDPFRAGYQLHKLFSVDQKDPGSKPNIPIGGNPSLGY